MAEPSWKVVRNDAPWDPVDTEDAPSPEPDLVAEAKAVRQEMMAEIRAMLDDQERRIMARIEAIQQSARTAHTLTVLRDKQGFIQTIVDSPDAA